MAVTIGKLRFPTQSAASSYFEIIRNRYARGATVSADDAEVLFNLLEHHSHRGAPNRQETKGFIVDNSAWGKPCFYAITNKGSRFALSTSRSAAYNSTPAGAAKLALRLLAKNETKLARNRFSGPVKCHHCPTIVSASEVEMDHYPERFEQLLARFLTSKGIALTAIKTINEGQGKVALENGELKSSWMAFHRTQATLVPSCIVCNRQS